MEAPVEIQIDPGLDLENIFVQISTELSLILERHGHSVRPFVAGLPHFRNLKIEKQRVVVQHINFYKDLCIGHEAEGFALKDSLSFTWRALRQLGLTPSSDLFNQLTNDYIVEIFSKDNVQLFRNFRFFDFCSYSLEELYCVEWWFLYERDESVGPKLISEVMKLLNGELSRGFRPNVNDHIVKESQSPELLKMQYEVTWIDPVFKNKDVAGFVALEKATLL